jgi:hypothetical protein
MRVAHAIAPPLSPQVKLAIINAMLQKNQRRLLSSVPPSQIMLTPAQAAQGAGSLVLQGIWTSQPPSIVMLRGNNQDNLTFMFCGLTQGTYLLDISVDSAARTAAWVYSPADGPDGTLTPQQGHLLYPFISAGLEIQIWPPNDGGFHYRNSTELTQVA